MGRKCLQEGKGGQHCYQRESKMKLKSSLGLKRSLIILVREDLVECVGRSLILSGLRND